MSNNQFFIHFEKSHQFYYNPDLSEEQNFNLLVQQLNITGKRLNDLRKRFITSNMNTDIKRETLLSNINEINDDLLNVSRVGGLEEFFSYFSSKYPNLPTFTNPKLKNPLQKFKSLESKLRLKDVYSAKYDYLWSLEEGVYQEYLDNNLSLNNISFEKNESFDSKFEKLADALNWKDYSILFRTKFNELVGNEAQKLSNNLEDLQEIIKRYKLVDPDKIPNQLNLCKTIIIRDLYVNIYDFIEVGNKQKFNSLQALRNYTINNNKIFPLDQAKRNFVYSVFLRNLQLPKKRKFQRKYYE